MKLIINVYLGAYCIALRIYGALDAVIVWFTKLMSYFQAWKSAKFVFHWVNVGQTRTQNIRKVL